MYHEYAGDEKFETIFFGGGTPSLMEPEMVESIINLLRTTFWVASDAEITLETNPGTIDRKKFIGFRSAGVNRLSMGIQSFHEDDLLFLTRIHTSEEAVRAVELAKEIGFTNINVDLIFALPNQTFTRWEDNLQKAVRLSPQHISAYNLIIEKGTPLADMVKNNKVSPLSTDEEADLYEFTMEYLEGEGYEHYEVSNYAKPGFRSKHNANYWNRSNYLGFGPSAHSFWSIYDTVGAIPLGTNRRWWNVRSIKKYCEDLSVGKLPIAGEEILNLEQTIDEFVMLGLRSSGVDLVQLKNDLGVNLLNDNDGTIKQLIDNNLAVVDKQVLRLTQKGFLLCDEISKSFLSRGEAS